MVHESGVLRFALATAVGDDPALVAELRGVFLAEATAMAAALDRSAGTEARRATAWRLHGLAASFGATDLMALAARMARDGTADAACRRRIDEAIAAFEG